MIRLAIAAMVGVFLLAGCGVDGPPEPPAKKTTAGVSVSGKVKVGVSGSS